MREIAVFGGTAHPALAAEICADLGVRCAASQASSAAAWPCCPVAAPNSEPLHDESPDELGQGREDVEDQPTARGGGVQRLVQGPEPGAAAAEHALVSLLALNGLRVSEATGDRKSTRLNSNHRP